MKLKFWSVLSASAAILFRVGAESGTDSLRSAAIRGDAASQFALGTEYFFGRNSRKVNPTLAFFWFRKAAHQGNARAQYNLGACYERGWGTEKSPARAFYYYSRAAEQNLAAAQVRRACLLFHGVPKDPESGDPRFSGTTAVPAVALNELRRLAAAGVVPARLELAGLLFGNRSYLQQHGGEVRRFLAEEARKPDAPPQVLRLYATMLRNGLGGIADFRRAVRILKRGAAKNDPESLFLLAGALENGEGCKSDPASAVKLYERAAALGHPGARLRMGELYLLGDRLPHDPVKAFDCFRAAAKEKAPRAFFRLGEAYWYGIGVEPAPARAVEAYEAGARLNDSDCQFRLSCCLFDGRGGRKDSAGALYWLKRSAAGGCSDAVRELGSRLLEGRGLPRNAALGRRLLDSLPDEGGSSRSGAKERGTDYFPER